MSKAKSRSRAACRAGRRAGSLPAVHPLRLAMLASLGVAPQLLAANNIVTDGRTQTVLDVAGSVTDIRTTTTSGANAFNSFRHFEVDAGQRVNLHVPGGAQNLINLVRDSRVLINGELYGLQAGSIGGNIVFADPHGFVVGAAGVVNVGSLLVATPTSGFLDRLVDAGGAIDDAAAAQLLRGAAPQSASGVITLGGQVNARDTVVIQGQTVSVPGQIAVDVADPAAAAFELSVNTAGLEAGSTLQVRDGDVVIVGRGSVDIAGDITAGGTGANDNGGGITVLASEAIDVAGGASVRSLAGSGGARGDVTLHAANAATVESGTAEADARVSIAGTVEGHNVTVRADTRVATRFDDGLAAMVVEQIGSRVAGADGFEMGIVEARGDATVNIAATAVLDAAADLNLRAEAERLAATPAIRAAGTPIGQPQPLVVAAVYGGLEGDTKVEIAGGATLEAGQDLNVEAVSDNTVAIEAVSSTADKSSYFAATLALGQAQVNTSATVAAGASLRAGDLNIAARNDNSFSVKASAKAKGEGQAGMSAAIADFATDASATLAADLPAGQVRGDVIVQAESITRENLVKSGASTGSGFADRTIGTIGKGATGAGTKAVGFIKSKLGKSQQSADTASKSAPSDPAGSKVKLSSAVALSTQQHDATARIASGSRIDAGQDLVIAARVHDAGIRNIATSGISTQAKDKDDALVTGSAAIAIGLYGHQARALVGDDAELAAERIGIAAHTELPVTIDWHRWEGFSSISSKLSLTAGVPEQVLSSYASAAGKSKTLGFAGALSYFQTDNHSLAWVGDNVRLSGRASAGAAPRETILGSGATLSWDEVVAVQARTLTQSINVAGNIGLGFAVGGSGKAVNVGGAFNWVNYDNSARAGIAGGASVTASGLAVTAEGEDYIVAVSPTSGSGGSIAGNGIAAYTGIDAATQASISHDAEIDAARVSLDAAQAFNVWSISGAVAQAEAAGVGLAAAINDIRADTRAYIGDNRELAEGETPKSSGSGEIRTDKVSLRATSDGAVAAMSVAAAMAKSADPDASPGFVDRQKSKLGNKVKGLRDGAANKLDKMPLLNKISGKVRSTQKAPPAGSATPTQPKFGLAVSGAASANIAALVTEAYLQGANVVKRSAEPGARADVTVRAISDTDFLAVAGGAALAKANNPSSKFSAAAAGSVAFNLQNNRTHAAVRDSAISGAGDTTIQALAAGDAVTIGAGLAVNASSDQDKAATMAGSASLTWLENDTRAELVDSTVTGLAGGAEHLQLHAYDRTRLINGGGALNGGGKAGVGTAISFAHIGNSTQALIDGGSVSEMDTVDVGALSAARIIAGAAMGSITKEGSTLSGAFVLNDIANTVRAGIGGGASVSADGEVAVIASGAGTDGNLEALLGARRDNGEFSLARPSAEPAEDGQTIDDARWGEDRGGAAVIAVAGQLQGGQNNVGLSFVGNDIRNVYEAYIDDALVAAGGTLRVRAADRSQLIALAAGVGGAGGKFAGLGSIVGNLTVNQVEARIGSRAATPAVITVSATGIELSAANGAEIWSGAGSVAGSKGSSAAVAAAYNQTTNSTTAEAINATVDAGSGALTVDALSESSIRAIAASIAGGKTAAISGSLTFNLITDTARALLSASTVSADSLLLRGRDRDDEQGSRSRIWSLAGNVAGAGKAAIGGAFSVNTVANTVQAEASGGSITLREAAAVDADSGAQILSIAVGGGGAGTVAAGLSSAVNTISNTVSARLENLSLTDAALDTGSLRVRARDRLADGGNGSEIWSLAGNVAGAGKAALGLAAAVNTIVNSLTAEVIDSAIDIGGRATVDADSAAAIKSAAVAGGGAGAAAVQGSATTNNIVNTVRAKLAGGSLQAASLRVGAGERDDVSGSRTSIMSLAGAVNGAGTAAIGAAVAEAAVISSIDALVSGTALTVSGATEIGADMGADIYTAGVSGGGAGSVAAGASVVVNTITSSASARLENATLHDGAGNTGSLDVRAHDRYADGSNGSRIWSLAGNVSGAGTASVGGASAVNTISNSVVADVLDSDIDIGGAARIDSDSGSEIKSAAVAGGGAGAAAVQGSLTLNTVANAGRARLQGGSLKAASLAIEAGERGDGSSVLSLRSSIITLAGAVNGAGTATVGAASATNTISNTLDATLDGSDVDTGAGAVRVEVRPGAEIRSIAASGGGSGAASVGGTLTLNTIANTAAAAIKNATIAGSGSVEVLARDRIEGAVADIIGSYGSTIWSLGGNVEGAGAASVGASAGSNLITNTLSAEILDSAVTSRGAVRVQTDSGNEIKAATATGGGSGAADVRGAVTVNTITNTNRARFKGGSLDAAGGLAVEARERDDANALSPRSSIIALAGAVGGAGAATVGGVSATNTITNTLEAILDGSSVDTGTSAIRVEVAPGAEIRSIAASGGGSGAASVSGTLNINTISNRAAATVKDTTISRSGGLEVLALDRLRGPLSLLGSQGSSIWALAGNAEGAGAASVGASASTNTVANTLAAELIDSDVSSSGEVRVEADSGTDIKAAAAGGGGAGAADVRGSVTLNTITNQVKARVQGGAIAATGLAVSAGERDDANPLSLRSSILSFAGAVGGAGAAAVNGALATNTIANTLEAILVGTDVDTGAGAVRVDVAPGAEIRSAAAAGGGAGAAAVQGAVTVNTITSRTAAVVENATIHAGSLRVRALDRLGPAAGWLAGTAGTSIWSLAGAVNGAGVAAVGGAASTNTIVTELTASLTDSTVNTSGAVQLETDAGAEIRSAAASGGGAGVAAVHGSVAVNTIVGTSRARLAGGTVTADSVSVLARERDQASGNRSSIWATAGAVGGAGTAAVGLASAINTIAGDLLAELQGAVVTSTGTTAVEVEAGAEIRAAAASAGGAGPAAVSGALTVNTLANRSAALLGGAQVNAAELLVRARDRWADGSHGSSIWSLAGNVQGAGAAAVGAAAAANTISNQLRAEVADSRLQVTDSTRVLAEEGAEIKTLAAAGGAALAAAVGGSATVNNIANTVSAGLRASGGDAAGNHTLIRAEDHSSIESIAGSVRAAGAAGVGAAGAVNRIGNRVQAYFSASDGSPYKADSVVVSAASEAGIRSLALGVSAGGAAGVAGSIATNLLDTRVEARIDDGARVHARNNVGVLARNDDRIESVAGAGGIGAAVGGGALSSAINVITGETLARISGSETRVTALAGEPGETLSVYDGALNSEPGMGSVPEATDFDWLDLDGRRRQVSGVAVNAYASQQVGTLSASVAGSLASVGAGLTASPTVIAGKTEAYIDGARINEDNTAAGAGQQIDISAASHSYISGYAAGAAGGGAGMGGAVASGVISRETRAYAQDAQLNNRGALRVAGQSGAGVRAIGGTAGAGGASFGGTGMVGLLQGTTEAYLDNSRISSGDVRVQAASRAALNLLGGTLQLGGAAFGSTLAAGVSANTTRAYIDGGRIDTAGSLDVEADADTRLWNLAISGAAGVAAGRAGMGVVNVVANTVEAEIRNAAVGQHGVQPAAVTIAATDQVAASSSAGALAGGVGAGMSAAANVTLVQSRVTAQLIDSDLRSNGALLVSADSSTDIDHVTVTGSGAGVAGLSGAASLILLGSGDSGEAMSELNAGGNGTLSRLDALLQDDKFSDGDLFVDAERDRLTANEDLLASRQTLRDHSAERADRLGETQLAPDGAEQSALNARADYDLKSRYTAADTDLTRAAVSGGTLQAASVSVSATDRTRTNNLAGAAGLGAGLLGAGGAVAISRVYGDVQAALAPTSLSTPGALLVQARALNGAAGDAVRIDALAGGAGMVGLGAAVADGLVSNSVSAELGGTVNAGASQVDADDDSRIAVEGQGASAGALAVGAVLADAVKTSGVSARLQGGSVFTGSDDLRLTADATGRVDAKAVAAAGGLAVAGSGAVAGARDAVVVLAETAGNATASLAGDLLVQAGATPQARAEALGVAVSAGAGIGASVARAEVASEVRARLADHSSISAGDITVRARQLLPGAAQSAWARAQGAGGGLLFGANATLAEAFGSSTVHATVAQNAALDSRGSIAVQAINDSDQNAEATGVAGGYLAVGANIADARSNGDTEAALDGKLTTSASGNISVSARGVDDNHAQAVAGNGGVIAGHAAVARTTANSSTQAWLQRYGSDADKVLLADRIEVSAEHTTRFNGRVDSRQAALAGRSAAITRHRVATDTDARIGAGARSASQHLTVTAYDRLEKPWLADYNIQAGAGGIASGAAADGDTRVSQDTDVVIGDGADLRVIGDRKAEHDFLLQADNHFELRDRSRLDTGGAIAIAMANNLLRVDASRADVRIGANAILDSVGNITAGARTYGRAEAQANAKAYAVAGAARGDSEARIDAFQGVSVLGGAVLRADGDIFLQAGRGRDGSINDIYAIARTDVWNKTAFPVTVIDALGRVDETASLNIAADARVRGVQDIYLRAAPGQVGGSGQAVGKDLYRKAAEDAANAAGKAVGAGEASWELKAGSSRTHDTGTVRVDGLVEAGIQNEQFLTLDWDAAANGGLGSHIISRRSDEGVNVRIGTRVLAQELQGRLDELYGLRREYAGNSDAVGAYNIEISRLENQLRELTGSGGSDYASRDVEVRFIEVAPIIASAGDIRIDASTLGGSGSLVAPGDARIEVINNTPYFLQLGDLTVPADEGGRVLFNGNMLSQAGTDFASVITGHNSPDPSILVKNTYDPDAVGNDSRWTAPDIYVSGDISNLLGSITLQAVAGSVVAEGKINAKTINLSAGRDFVLGYAEGFRHIGSAPEGQWSDITRKLETGEYHLCGDDVCRWETELIGGLFPIKVEKVVAERRGRDGDGSLVAGNNVYISGRYLNINGTIQSGLPDWNLTLSGLDTQINAAESTYAQRLSRGDSNPYVALTSWQQGAGIDGGGRRVTAWWNARENRIELDGIKVEGGYMELFGQIMSTGGGQLKVLDGYGQIRIDNQTGRDLVLRDLDTGRGVEGTLKITDLGRRTADGKALTTLYKRVDGAVQVWDSVSVDANGNPARLLSSSSGRRASYNTLGGQRYYWVTGEAFTDYEHFKESKASKTFFDLFPLDALFPANYSWSNPAWRKSDLGKSLAEGQYAKQVGSNYDGYQYSRSSTTTSGWSYGEVKKSDKCTDYFIGCIERTYYAEQTRWKGSKTFYTHSVAADGDLDISFIGFDEGLIAVRSNAGLLLNGRLSNRQGETRLQGVRIERLSADAAIYADQLYLNAAVGIGTRSHAAAVAGLDMDVTGALVAHAGGDVRLSDLGGDLRIDQVLAGGDVDIAAKQDLLLTGMTAGNVIRGRQIKLSSDTGAIGSTTGVINLDTASGDDGLFTARASGGIHIREISGDLRLNTVDAGGDVYVEAVDGRIMDGNREDSGDTRAEAELLALWDDMELTGSAAADAANAGVDAVRRAGEAEYHEYWRLRAVRGDGAGGWTAEAYDPAYRFSFSAEEAALLKQQNGFDDARLAELAQQRSDRFHALHARFGGGGYDPNYRHVVDTAALTEGAAWTQDQLRYSISRGLLDGSSDTETRTEVANVRGANVTLVADAGGIGSTLAAPVVIDFSGGVSSLTREQKIALASAERDDLSFDEDTITIIQREDLDVEASGEIVARARDELFLGGENDINISDVASPVVRIKAGRSIIGSRTDGPVIVADEAVLEAASGRIAGQGGDGALHVQIADRLTLRAGQDIDLVQHGGGLNLAGLFTTDHAALTVLSGGLQGVGETIIDARAGSLNLDVAGSVGNGAEAFTVQLSPGGRLSGKAAALYLDSPAGGLNLGAWQVTDAAALSSAGQLILEDQFSAGGLVSLAAADLLRLADGAQLDGDGAVSLAAVDLLMDAGSRISADGAITLNATGDIGLARLVSEAGGHAVSVSAGGRIDGDGGEIEALNGEVDLSAGRGIGRAAQPLMISAERLAAVSSTGDVHLELLGDINASRIAAESGRLNLAGSGALQFDTLEASADLIATVAGGLNGSTLRSTAGSVTASAASADITTVSADTGVTLSSTSGDLRLGEVSSGGTQQYTAARALTATTFIGGALTAQADSVDLGRGEFTGDAALSSTGSQTLGTLKTGGAQTLQAGTLLTAAHLDAGGAVSIGSAAQKTGAVDVTRLDSGATLAISTRGEQTLGNVISIGAQTLTSDAAIDADSLQGQSLAAQADTLSLDRGEFSGRVQLTTAGAQTIGTRLKSGAELLLRAGGSLTAKWLEAATSVTIGDAADNSGSVAIDELTAGTTLSIHTSGDQTLGDVTSGAAQTLQAGGAIDAGSLRGSTLEAQASLLSLGRGEFTGDAALTSTGAQTLGTLKTGGAQTLQAGGLLTAAHLDAGGAVLIGSAGQQTGAVDITRLDSGSTLAITTRGNQTLGDVNSVDGQRLTADAAIDAGRLKGRTLQARAASLNLSNGDFSGRVQLNTTGAQTIGTLLKSGAEQVLRAGGLLTAKRLEAGSFIAIGDAADNSGSVAIDELAAGTSLSIHTSGDQTLGAVLSGTTQTLWAGGAIDADSLQGSTLEAQAHSLTLANGDFTGSAELTSTGAQTLGTLKTDGAQTLQAGGLLTAAHLDAGGLVSIGSAAHKTGAVDITLLEGNDSLAIHTSGDQTLGAVLTIAEQTLQAGGLIDAGRLQGSRLAAQAGSLILGDGVFSGTAEVLASGDQRIGKLASGGEMRLRTSAGSRGNIAFGTLVAGDPASVGGGYRLGAPALTVSADGSLLRQAAGLGDATAEGMLTLTGERFDVGELRSAGADVTLDAVTDLRADRADARRDLRIGAGGDMVIGQVEYGNELSLRAGRHLRARVGGDIRFATAEVGGDAELWSGGVIALDSLQAGGKVTLDAEGDVTADTLVQAGGSVALRSRQNVRADRVVAGGGVTVAAAGEARVREIQAGGASEITAGGLLRVEQLQVADGGFSASSGADTRLDTAAVAGTVSLDAGADLVLGSIVSGADQWLSAGGAATLSELISQGAIYLAARGGAISADRASAGTDLRAEAGAVLDFEQFQAGGWMALDAGGDITGRSLLSGASLTANAGVVGERVTVPGASLSVDTLAAAALTARAGAAVTLGSARVAHRADLRAAERIRADLRHTGGGRVLMSASAVGGAPTDSLVLNIDAPVGAQFDTLAARRASIVSSGADFGVRAGHVEEQLDLHTAQAHLLMDNIDRSRRRVDVHLYEPDKRFSLQQTGRLTFTDSYVVAYTPGFAVQVPNFTPQRAPTPVPVDGRSLAKDSEQESRGGERGPVQRWRQAGPAPGADADAAGNSPLSLIDGASGVNLRDEVATSAGRDDNED
ncbi:leukotoxin LktA family filamentous adhesin [Alkalilimnicola sp. S0819]|uniref:leukotoxin LktA family filamentous adhesin n=1 Tax=Alkalilimnicola sp. S0819 TaxID=2613922 RepID=UPI0012622303|nr:leukotoxin LktA family filamentous adhesin [Alkalilimnicola sp. S0819]KAB7623810.1 leukotoxin LktA family filamentous adhesin [Alkalilimnicola sp. S0819]MPQ16684.1 leukotoxin LktA family filamentous adhesin [Alkalilimnicola sp. S0819]